MEIMNAFEIKINIQNICEINQYECALDKFNMLTKDDVY